MKTKRDKDYYLARAATGFKTLVIYYNVTRPQYEKAYHKDGKFSTDELLKQLDFLDGWKRRTARERRILAHKYATYARTFNYTFSIPSELVNKVLGEYRDEHGNLVRIHKEEVIDKLVRDGYIKVLNHGSKTKKGEDGKIHKICYWGKKYLLANREYWFKLLSDSRYSDYAKYPIDDKGFVLRAVGIIAKYRKQTIPHKPIQESTDAKPTKNFTQHETTLNREKFKERLVKELAEGLMRGLVNEGAVENEFVRAKFSQKEIDYIMPRLRLMRKKHMEQLKAKNEQLKAKNDPRILLYREMKQKYLEGVVEYDEFRKWMITNQVVDKIVKEWDDYELARISEKAQEEKPVEPPHVEQPRVEKKVDLDELVKLVG